MLLDIKDETPAGTPSAVPRRPYGGRDEDPCGFCDPRGGCRPCPRLPAADEHEIREIQARWDDAWNRHDIKALSALVAEDVRFVNVAGVVLNGRDEFEKLQTRTHAMQFKDSVRTVTATDIKFLSADMAVAHVKWGMRGDKDADGTPRPPRNGVMMQVLVKRGGAWTIVAVQNTNVR